MVEAGDVDLPATAGLLRGLGAPGCPRASAAAAAVPAAPVGGAAPGGAVDVSTGAALGSALQQV